MWYIVSVVCRSGSPRLVPLRTQHWGPPCFSSLNREDTERLSDLCAEALLATEGRVRTESRKIFAEREGITKAVLVLRDKNSRNYVLYQGTALSRAADEPKRIGL